jgi:hypothetical protein
MARRTSRSKTKRRSRPKTTNVLRVAQSVIMGNAVTHGLFNVNAWEFVSGRVGGTTMANASGASWSQSNITLPELVGFGMNVAGGQGGQTFSGYGGIHHGTLMDQIKTNLQANAGGALTTLIVTPIAFKVISKVAAQPRREFNKLARTVGLPISM